MNNIILIVVDNDQPCANYHNITGNLQNKIVSYYGSKFAQKHETSPVVQISCDITQDDIELLKKDIPNSITLIVIKMSEESVQKYVNYDIIDLS